MSIYYGIIGDPGPNGPNGPQGPVGPDGFLIDRYEVTSATGSVTFTNIPQTYTDLTMFVNVHTPVADTSGQTYMTVQLNGDTGNNYNYFSLGQSGTGASAMRYYQVQQGITGNTGEFYPTTFRLIINGYSTTSWYKLCGGRITAAINFGNNAPGGLWTSTAAVTSITFGLGGTGTVFAVGSTFYLFAQ